MQVRAWLRVAMPKTARRAYPQEPSLKFPSAPVIEGDHTIGLVLVARGALAPRACLAAFSAKRQLAFEQTRHLD
jgi:hypothetical protein